MNSAANSVGAVDPDEVLGEHTRRLSAEYRARLADAYADPRAAARAFHEEASRIGPAEAAIRMRDEPEHYGPLKPGGEAAARPAAAVGARAYHSRVAEDEPGVASAVLDQLIADRLQGARGLDREQVRTTWDALSRAYGPDRAADVFTRRSRDVLGESLGAEEVLQLARFAAARDHFRTRAGLVEPPTQERCAPLPRSLEEAGRGGLPPGLSARLLAASDGMRTRLAGAYEAPLVAEARLHQMVDGGGLDAIVAVHRDPTVLGPLRGDLPGGTDRARGLAASAMHYASIAYEYHRVGGPEDAERLHARDALADTRRSARDPERAMAGLQEAVQLNGPEMQAHLDRQRERGIDRDGEVRRGHEHDAQASRGGPGHGAGDRAETRGGELQGAGGASPVDPDGTAPSGDPEVEAAVRAHVDVEEARELEKRLRTLRTERRRAEEKLAELREQDAALTRAHRDLRATAAEVYRNPDEAIRRWQEAVAADGPERARARLKDDPAILGELRRKREPGPVRRAARAAVRAWRGSPGTEERAGTDARSQLASRAEAFARAEAATRRPVEWTTPDGETVVGREEVRGAARKVSEGRQQQIDAGEKRLKALGGVEGAEKSAQRALDVLSPAQRQDALHQIAKATRASAVDVATGMARQAVEAVRIARTLGEGPAGP